MKFPTVRTFTLNILAVRTVDDKITEVVWIAVVDFNDTEQLGNNVP